MIDEEDSCVFEAVTLSYLQAVKMSQVEKVCLRHKKNCISKVSPQLRFMFKVGFSIWRNINHVIEINLIF